MTNADCIRRMNDEQLYEFLSEWECGDIDYSVTFCDLCKQGGNELNLDCDGCRKHWLQRNALYMSVVNNGQMACRLIKRLPPKVVLEMVAEILEDQIDET